MKKISTGIPGFAIKYATRKDTKDILHYIKELAEHENELDGVTATESTLADSLFRRKAATALLAEFEGKNVGFAIFHYSFSTFLGRPGINLVDLYIEPEMRNKGFGREMLAYLSSLTMKDDCGRLEWWVHDWNDDAKRFYKRIGAVEVDNIRIYRLTGEALEGLGKSYDVRPL
jgi:GNAT superfamily N-acetyltransferase